MGAIVESLASNFDGSFGYGVGGRTFLVGIMNQKRGIFIEQDAVYRSVSRVVGVYRIFGKESVFEGILAYMGYSGWNNDYRI